MTEPTFWKRCSTCKKELPFAAAYWACNVSTCNRVRTALAFCSVPCWDAHVPMLRHRDAWAVGSSRVDLQACKLEYSIVSPK